MMKGDAYSLPIQIETDSGIATEESFAEIEICIGNTVRKTFSSGEITYEKQRAVFLVPLTQEETFRLHGRARVNVRCKYASGDVVGVDLGVLAVTSSLSKEVI